VPYHIELELHLLAFNYEHGTNYNMTRYENEYYSMKQY
jgi:hypothetical protein